MTQIQDLERQLAKLKREQNFDLWKKWHSEGKNFLEKLVGRCFITQTHNDSFYMYKVISVKEQKVWGTKHDYGYFELLTEGHFHIRNAKHIYGSGIELPNDRGPYRTFTLIDKSKKGKVISDIDYNGKPEQNL